MPKHYYQIGEVANMLNVKRHTLRYWESEFPKLRPRKNRSGKRIYTREDINLLKKIKYLLYELNYSIEGARKKMAKEKQGSSQLEIPLESQSSHEIKRKIKGRVAKIRDIIEITPTMTLKITRKERAKANINKIMELLKSEQTAK